MSLVKALFGPSREEIWRQLSREVGGQFHEGGFFTPSAVQARTHDWIITLDTHTQGDGNTNVHLHEALGMQDMERARRDQRRGSAAPTPRSPEELRRAKPHRSGGRGCDQEARGAGFASARRRGGRCRS